jgi:putative hydrolase
MLQSDGPVNWEIAGQIAAWVAVVDPETLESGQPPTELPPEPPVDPDTVSSIDGLARAVQARVAEATGIDAAYATPVRVVTRREWADLHLTALRPVLEAFATTLQRAMLDRGDDAPETPAVPDPSNPFGFPMGADPLGGILTMLAPVLLGVQAGTMVGHLAQHSLGRYDLPLPTADEPGLCFIARNLDEFETAWELPRTDLRFHVVLHEALRAAERSVPWVQPRLVRLSTEYVRGYDLDLSALEDQLGSFDPSDPSSISGIADDPRALLGAMQTPGQRELLRPLEVFTSVLEGYADVLLDEIGRPLIPEFDRINEARRRHRVERGEAERFVGMLLGLELDREQYEQGEAFCRGVIEREGIAGLNRLWSGEAMIPTRPEIEAPGLWLARIDL